MKLKTVILFIIYLPFALVGAILWVLGRAFAMVARPLVNGYNDVQSSFNIGGEGKKNEETPL